MAKGMTPDVYPRVHCIAVFYLPTTEVSAGCDCYSVSLQDRYRVTGLFWHSRATLSLPPKKLPRTRLSAALARGISRLRPPPRL